MTPFLKPAKKPPLLPNTGQASLEYILLVSLLGLILFAGSNEALLKSVDVYFTDIASVLNLPIP